MTARRTWPTKHPDDQATMSEDSLIWEDLAGGHHIKIIKTCHPCGARITVPWTFEVAKNEDPSRFVCVRCSA